MTYSATVEQHRRDYMGVLKNSPGYAEFNTVEQAEDWAVAFIQTFGGEMRFVCIEGPDYSATTSTDPGIIQYATEDGTPRSVFDHFEIYKDERAAS